MTTTKKKRRKLSPAQIAAGFGGKRRKSSTKKTTHKRKKSATKKAVHHKKTAAHTTKRVTKKGGAPVATHKKKRYHSSKKSSAHMGKKRRNPYSKHHTVGKGGVAGALKHAAIAIGGGLIAGIVANKLPIPDARLKAISPAIAGAALIATIGRKNPIAAEIGTGMMVLGGVSAIRALLPNVPLLAGEEEIVVDPALLGYSPMEENLYGVEDFGGVDIGDEDGVYVSPANL